MANAGHSLLAALLGLASLTGFTGSIGRAEAINGTLWTGLPGSYWASDLPLSPPAGTFVINGPVDYYSGNDNSVGAFYYNAVFLPTSVTSSGLDNTFAQLTGYLYLNSGSNTISLLHDDGVVLWINGVTVDNQPSPTVADQTPFTLNSADVGGSGWLPFTLNYAETNGPPAVLKFQVNDEWVTGAPEPASIALMGAGLVGLGLLARRSRGRGTAA